VLAAHLTPDSPNRERIGIPPCAARCLDWAFDDLDAAEHLAPSGNGGIELSVQRARRLQSDGSGVSAVSRSWCPIAAASAVPATSALP
jgi:hypothetical protein